MNDTIEVSWEEYDQYMIESGQWLTEHDYSVMIENEYFGGYADDEFDEGC